MASHSTDRWSSKLGFILGAVGSAVGLGNLWKFPYITYEYDGGAFVLVYLLALLIIGLPIMLAEMLVGKMSQTNLVDSFGKLGHGRWTFLGYLSMLTSFLMLSYYSVIAGWAFASFIQSLMTGGGWEDFGAFLANPWAQIGYHLLFMVLTIWIVMRGVSNGIEKLVRILMPALVASLIGLAAFALLSERTDAIGTLSFLFRPNFSQLGIEGILEAVGHAFFTLSLGMGVMMAYSAKLGKDARLAKPAFWIAGADTGIALAACLLIFPVIFAILAEGETELCKGVAILFTSVPKLLSELPGGSLISALFFLMVSFAALTSSISMLEVVVSVGVDRLQAKKQVPETKARIQTSLVVGGIVALLGIASALSNGADQQMGFRFFSQMPVSVPDAESCRSGISSEELQMAMGISQGKALEEAMARPDFGDRFAAAFPDQLQADDVLSFSRHEATGGLIVTRTHPKPLRNWLDLVDYLVSNWLLPLNGLLVAIFVGWRLRKSEKMAELLAGAPQYRWLYQLWDVLLRWVAPIAILVIMAMVLGVV
ncbi:MAG: sodium-dependent transporter [Bacteroidota bacterium]